MSRFAVIGSNSFSGAHFVDLLLEDRDNEVLGISRSPEKSDLFLPYKRHRGANFRFFRLDINEDMPEVMRVIDGFEPEFVVNYAAQGEVATSWKYPEQWFETNAVGVVKLCNFLKGREYLKRYVHISTPEVYGTCETALKEDAPFDPSTPYAASKAAGDLFIFTLVKRYGFPMVVIRSTNVYGKHQQLYRIIPRTIVYLKLGRKIQLHGGGKAVKSYIHIRDVSEGILKAARLGRQAEVYHLSPDGEISVRDLVARICSGMGFDFESSTETVPERPGQDARYRIDSSKARSELSWGPHISLDDGLKEVSRWIEDQWERIIREPLEYIHRP